MKLVSTRVFLSAVILHFLTSACARITVHPVSVPSIAIVCDLPRRYVVVDGTVTQTEEDALLSALDQINAVTPGLVVYAGRVAPSEAVAHLNAGSVVVVGAPERYNTNDEEAVKKAEGALAYTTMKTRGGGCLTGAALVILADLSTLPNTDLIYTVVAHEVMHSIGFGHADPDGAFKTIMEPSLRKTMPKGLAAADKRAIEAVYSRGFF